MYKVSIGEEAHLALRAESLVQGKNIQDTLTYLIIKALSAEARNMLNILNESRPQAGHIDYIGSFDNTIHHKKRLTNDREALSKIKELWESGQRNQAEIAREVGYKKSTVAENIRNLIARGVLEK